MTYGSIQAIPLGSVEAVAAKVTPAPGDDYTGATAEVSLTPAGGVHSWQAATLTADGAGYTVRTTAPVTFAAAGTFTVYLRINSGSAHPIAKAGVVRVS